MSLLQRLECVIEELGSTYIKFGNIKVQEKIYFDQDIKRTF